MPYPVDTGSRLTMSHRLEYAKKMGCANWIFVATKEDPDEGAVRQLADQSAGYWIYIRSKSCSEGLLGRLFKGMPFAVGNRYSKDMEDRIGLVAKACNASAIIVEYPQMMVNVSPFVAARYPLVLEQHNIEYKTALSLARSLKQYDPVRWLRSLEAYRLERYERSLNGNITPKLMTFVTKDDMDNYPFFKSTQRVLLTPGACDYSGPYESKGDHPNITFIANMTYKPNQEGALWLAKKVLPLVSKVIPEVKLILVGKNPPAEMRILAERNSSIVVTGRVDDLSEYYRRADVLALPVFAGGGINMKTLEASLSCRPVVATSFAMKGTDFISGFDYLEAESAHDFAEAIITILRNPDKAERMARQCYMDAESKYTWDVANMKWFNSIVSIVGEHIV